MVITAGVRLYSICIKSTIHQISLFIFSILDLDEALVSALMGLSVVFVWLLCCDTYPSLVGLFLSILGLGEEIGVLKGIPVVWLWYCDTVDP